MPLNSQCLTDVAQLLFAVSWAEHCTGDKPWLVVWAVTLNLSPFLVPRIFLMERVVEMQRRATQEEPGWAGKDATGIEKVSAF